MLPVTEFSIYQCSSYNLLQVNASNTHTYTEEINNKKQGKIEP